MKHYFKDTACMKQKEMSNIAITEALSLSRNTVNRSIYLMDPSYRIRYWIK